jgi:FkbM family methyltransferase
MSFHSQDNQDYFLEFNVFKGHKNGVFVDVGAHDGITINNTIYFERNNGWTGINIEPINDVYERLMINRPKCINLNCAVDETEGESEFILNKGYTEMISGLKKHYDDRHLKRLEYENSVTDGETSFVNVVTRRLEGVFDEYKINRINYLSVDVEGAEFNVIQSINFDKVFIDVIGFEDNYPDVGQKIIDYLETKGYFVIKKSMDIFMIHRDSEFNCNF